MSAPCALRFTVDLWRSFMDSRYGVNHTRRCCWSVSSVVEPGFGTGLEAGSGSLAIVHFPPRTGLFVFKTKRQPISQREPRVQHTFAHVFKVCRGNQVKGVAAMGSFINQMDFFWLCFMVCFLPSLLLGAIASRRGCTGGEMWCTLLVGV